MKTLRDVALLLIFIVLLSIACDDGSNGSAGLSNLPPNLPSNPYPADGAIGVETKSLTFRWDCSDPEGDMLRYTLKIYIDNMDCGPAVFTNVRTNSFKLTELHVGHWHTWRVEAEDQYGAITKGPWWHFQTQGIFGGAPNSNPRDHAGQLSEKSRDNKLNSKTDPVMIDCY